MSLTSTENVAKNKDTYKHANEIDTHPLAIEPFDKEWGVGISGNTPNPSPFARINSILRVTERTTNGFVAASRAELVTPAYRGIPASPRRSSAPTASPRSLTRPR
jgi:hypothetical protein